MKEVTSASTKVLHMTVSESSLLTIILCIVIIGYMSDRLRNIPRRTLLLGAAAFALQPFREAFAQTAAPAQIPPVAPHEPAPATRKPRLAGMVPDVITQGIDTVSETPIQVRALRDGRTGTGFMPTDWGAVDLTFPSGPRTLDTGSARLLTDPARLPGEMERKFTILISPPDFRLIISVGGRGFFGSRYGESLFDLSMFLERYDGRGDLSQAGSIFYGDVLTTHTTVPFEYRVSWKDLLFNPESVSRRSRDFDRFEDLVSP
jgi:hypothetical protein